MAIEVFPTAQDIGGDGTGRTATEENMVQTLARFSTQNTILSGMTPADGGGLSLTVAAGRCYIAGYLIRLPDFESVTVTDDDTKYVWLQLTGADSYAVSATAWVETDDLTSPPADAALVTKVITSSGGIVEVDDSARREGAGHRAGIYTGDSSSNQDIDLGLTPSYVQARHFDDVTNSFRWSQSNIFPGDRELETSIIKMAAQYFNPGGQNKIAWADGVNEGGLLIIKDGFRALGDLNENTKEYSYIAWF